MAEDNRLPDRDQKRPPEAGKPADHLGGIAGGAFAGGAAGGVAGAAVAGATAGTIAGGPIGTVAGALAGVVAGSVLGGLAGKTLSKRFSPEQELEYWRNEFPRCTYAVSSQYGWDDYWPAYRFGYERFPDRPDCSFEEVEPDLSQQWNDARGNSRLDWSEAREATRDAYERLRRSVRDENPQDRPLSDR